MKDKKIGRIKLLTQMETERIQGFSIGCIKYYLVQGEVIEMPVNKRRFMIGNVLVVDLVERI